MRRIVFLFVVLLLLTVGCTDQNSASKDSVNQNQESDSVEQVEEEANSNGLPEEAQEETKPNVDVTEEETHQGYKQFRPEVGTNRIFTENGTEMFSEKIIAENDEYIQILVSIGDSQTTEVYKWTEEEMTLVFQSNEVENPNESILDNFKYEEHEIIVGQNANWKLVDKDTTLTVPNGTYHQVFSVEKITEEVVGEKTSYKRFYAPDVGLIKEIVEVTGENGYKGESSLEKIQK